MSVICDIGQSFKIRQLVLLERRLLKIAKNRRFLHLLILASLFAFCTLLYYFGELTDFFRWDALRYPFFYGVHDWQRLCFFAPVMYACYYFRTKAMLAVTVASLGVFLPRALFVSPYPDALTRAIIFAVAVGAVCFLMTAARSKLSQQPADGSIGNGVMLTEVSAENRQNEDALHNKELEVDLARRLVKLRRQTVKLTPKEYEVLACLFRNKGRALTHRELLNNVWGSQYGDESEYVRNYIAQLRHKIEDNPSNPRFIITEPGFGYRFIEPE